MAAKAKQSHRGEGHRKDPLGQQSGEMGYVVRASESVEAKKEVDGEVDPPRRLT